MTLPRPLSFPRPVTASCEFLAAAESPAILRLKMLEMEIAARGPLPASARQSAGDLIGALKRAIAEKPALSFADVVAKLKTNEPSDDMGEKIDEARKEMMRSAFAEFHRPAARA